MNENTERPALETWAWREVQSSNVQSSKEAARNPIFLCMATLLHIKIGCKGTKKKLNEQIFALFFC